MRRISRTLPIAPALATLFATALAIGGLATTASAVVVQGNQASFTWVPASGPVAGYNVFVTRNGVPGATPELTVAGTAATVTSQINDTIAIRVSAFDSSNNQGPPSALSPVVVLSAVPPPPPSVIVSSTADLSIQAALATATAGEQVIAHMRGTTKQFLDAAPDPGAGIPDDEWGLDQLIVGEAGQPAEVRLVDAVGLDESPPLANLPMVTLFGLGNGPPCQRDGAPGLVIQPGSRLILGGIELYAFDGQSCILINDLFQTSADPNLVSWGGGEIQLYGDLEDDGILDPDDNCLVVANPNQCDNDLNGFGSMCDLDVNGDGAVGLDDVSLVLSGMRVSSSDPLLDLNCDDAVGISDATMVYLGLGEPRGLSGLACAADASCFVP